MERVWTGTDDAAGLVRIREERRRRRAEQLAKDEEARARRERRRRKRRDRLGADKGTGKRADRGTDPDARGGGGVGGSAGACSDAEVDGDDEAAGEERVWEGGRTGTDLEAIDREAKEGGETAGGKGDGGSGLSWNTMIPGNRSNLKPPFYTALWQTRRDYCLAKLRCLQRERCLLLAKVGTGGCESGDVERKGLARQFAVLVKEQAALTAVVAQKRAEQELKTRTVYPSKELKTATVDAMLARAQVQAQMRAQAQAQAQQEQTRAQVQTSQAQTKKEQKEQEEQKDQEEKDKKKGKKKKVQKEEPVKEPEKEKRKKLEDTSAVAGGLADAVMKAGAETGVGKVGAEVSKTVSQSLISPNAESVGWVLQHLMKWLELYDQEVHTLGALLKKEPVKK